MGDALVFILIALTLIVISGSIQYTVCHVFKALLIKLLPCILFMPLWLICVLGSFDIIDLPPTARIIDGGFIAFHDSDVIAVAGIPITLGLLLAWTVYAVIQRFKKRMTRNG